MAFLKDIDYKTHPDTIEIELGGDTYPWHLNREALRLAEEKHGVDTEEIFAAMFEMHQQGQNGSLDKILEFAETLVWAGFLVFDSDIERREVGKRLPVTGLNRTLKPIITTINKMGDDDLQELAGKAKGNG